jgi:hypothetical protein
MVKRNSAACCDDSGSPTPLARNSQTSQKFALTNPIGGCVPAEAMQNLPDFLQWFSKDATPIICAAQAIKDNPCMVLAGDVNGYRGITLSALVAECGVDGNIKCADLLAKIAYNKTTACIPTKASETADMVISADRVTGEIAWRMAPELECDKLAEFLKPTPIGIVGCFRSATTSDTITQTFSLTSGGELVWSTPSTSGTPATPGPLTCVTVKAALEGGCVAAGDLTSQIGFDAAGKLAKRDRKRLIRATFYGANTPVETFSDTLNNHGISTNRRYWKWQDFDSVQPVLAIGQYLGDMTYNATSKLFTIGHSANYRFSTSIFFGAVSPVTDANTSLSLLAGFRLDRTLGAAELRFGEITQELGGSSAIKGSSDYVFSGSWQGYLPAGSTIAVRFWAAPGLNSGSKIVDLRAEYYGQSNFCIEELAPYD